MFLDTADFRLYNNSFILRRRTEYQDGFPIQDPEIVFKFRNADMNAAAAIDVRPHIAGPYRVKFKSEALPLKDQIGGFRLLYAHNCIFPFSSVRAGDRTNLKTIARGLPALAGLIGEMEGNVELVNSTLVEEVLLDLGMLDFGKGVVSKANISLWRSLGDHSVMCGEFAYQTKFDRREDVHEVAKQRVEEFFIKLQLIAAGWLFLGTTKTGLVYRLKGNAPQVTSERRTDERRDRPRQVPAEGFDVGNLHHVSCDRRHEFWRRRRRLSARCAGQRKKWMDDTSFSS